MLRKLKIIFVALLLAITMVGCGESTISYTPGTYTATVTGQKEMTVTVTFSESKIEEIQIDHEETPGIGVPVVEAYPDEIIELQGLGIDLVTGATLTSQAIIDGVADCAEQAGADVEALKAIKPTVEKEDDLTLEADVVVVGAGGAGMAAAVTASQQGKTVVVIEKTNKMGG
ncbi:MAG: FMN-binding protein, partial [Erysipelotrichaceae bacterium]